MIKHRLKFAPEFDWKRVAWGLANSPQRALCSYCHGALPECPLMLWREDGAAMQLCDPCVEAMVVSEVLDEDGA